MFYDLCFYSSQAYFVPIRKYCNLQTYMVSIITDIASIFAERISLPPINDALIDKVNGHVTGLINNKVLKFH